METEVAEMANTPLYDLVMGGQAPQPQTAPMMPAMPMGRAAMNPFQKMQMVMQAMRNPAGYLKEKFPDIPDQYMNDPNLIMQYLQQSRNISNQQVQQIANQIPKHY